jgi:hypothetical protein
MQTDHPIYRFLALGPEAFRVLASGRTLTGPYRFRAIDLKTLERRLDGVFEPEGHEGPVYLVEFQGRPGRTAHYNLLTKVGLYGEAHPDPEIRGLLVFLHGRLDPGRPGLEFTDGSCQVLHLDRFLPGLLEREPDNPYAAALAPLVWPTERLQREARRLWQTIQQAELTPEVREGLSDILVFWLFESFKALYRAGDMEHVTGINNFRRDLRLSSEGDGRLAPPAARCSGGAAEHRHRADRTRGGS